MITLEQVKKVIPSVIKIEVQENEIKVFYTKNAPMWKIKKTFGKFYFKWKYDPIAEIKGIKERIY